MTTGVPEMLEGPSGPVADSAGEQVAARSPLQLFWRQLRGDKVALAALIVIVILLLIAIFAPLVTKLAGAPRYDQGDVNALHPNDLELFGLPQGPSSKHLFGVTPQTGYDVFSRVIYGTRVSLLVAFVATGLSALIGVTVGLLAGYYRGWVDTILSRTMDVVLAFPIFLLALGLAASCTIVDSDGKQGCLGGLIKPGLTVVIVVIVISTWPYFARIIRGQVLSMREKEFVEAARSLGASDRRIIFREILPNLVTTIMVYATLLIPSNILFEAALSFLGVGVQEPTPSWGKMIADATSGFNDHWWFMLFPGIALLTTVLAFNLLGDGLQDAINPRSRGRD
ncbi:MAG: peptide/nickel transport system permease protein [Thermoleophilaceae bacterium]|nr:peptide/nickel transport system permease protein [Thermoleophilaceae bacterium]MEA2481299.1 peptide/nickel transport system permease protein [Thermoleophilaceae bacterium]